MARYLRGQEPLEPQLPATERESLDAAFNSIFRERDYERDPINLRPHEPYWMKDVYRRDEKP